MEDQELYTVKQFCEKNRAFTQGGVRHLIFYADENGLAKSGALIRLGRKILLDEALFIGWVRSHASVAAA